MSQQQQEYVRSNLNVLTNSTSSRWSSSRSLGNPDMNVVRRASPGMRSRSLFSSSMVWSLGGRFMARSVRLEMCWRGMSMYFATLGLVAISSMRSSEKYDG